LVYWIAHDGTAFGGIISRRVAGRTPSTIITSSRPLEEWMGLFDDPLLANSLLDRLAHNAHQIFTEGESYRKRMGRANKATKKN
jgi:DNA replication protein DnaC